jgi:ribosomal protein S24E
MLVFFLFFRGPHHPNPKQKIIKCLNFDKDQVSKYEKLVHLHRDEVIKMDKEIFNLKQKLYATLASQENPIMLDSLSTEIGKIQKEIELLHYQHFEDIKKICTKEQIPVFNELTKEFGRMFSRKPPKKR